MPVSFIAIAAALVQAQTPAGSPLAAPVEPAFPTAAAPRDLPRPSQDPLRIDRDSDPVLALARNSTPGSQFIDLVQMAVERHPAVDEAAAGILEAEAATEEARAGRYPTIDLSINSQRSIIRNFEADDVNNIVERARARGRSDLTVNVQQTLFDWGATERRIAAAGARLRAAAFQTEAQADQIALRAIAAWYDVFAYRALVDLATAFMANQQDLRSAIETRITQGVSAPGDLPRVESYIASADADLARFRRQLANAEARFEEFYGVPAPPGLGRAPILERASITKDAAEFLARSAPEVEAAEAAARAALHEARAERSANRPSLQAGIDAGKYGIIDRNDYDVRGRLTLRHRFFGGGEARVDQAFARANAAEARASRVRNEAEREAAVAWSDVRALEQQLAALENSYIASRQSRDVLAERFRVARGTLFDLLETESSYFNVAATYIRTITELDASRYVLLSSTGQLLPALRIEPTVLEIK